MLCMYIYIYIYYVIMYIYIYIYYLYVYIYILSSRSSFDLSCTDELSKSETAAVYRLIVYIILHINKYQYATITDFFIKPCRGAKRLL